MIDNDSPFDEAEWLLDQAERVVRGELPDGEWDDPDLSNEDP